MSKIYTSFQKHETSIRRIFARRFASREDVEDLSQEVFVRCFAAEMKSPIEDPKAFLLRSAKNLALAEIKKKVRTTTDSFEESGGLEVYVDEHNVSAETRLDVNRKLAVLAEAIASLPPRQREAFWMRKVDQLTLAQIATRLGISTSTAKYHVVEALLKCDAFMRAHGYDPEEFGSGGQSQKEAEGQAGQVIELTAAARRMRSGGSRD